MDLLVELSLVVLHTCTCSSARKKFSRFAAPLLHLSGVDVTVVEVSSCHWELQIFVCIHESAVSTVKSTVCYVDFFSCRVIMKGRSEPY